MPNPTSNINVKSVQSVSGGNHSAIIENDAHVAIGVAHWDPARGQFAFMPVNPNLVLSTADATSITTILNGLSR